ncbi:MAG: nucleoside-binding protein [Bacteroidota bacterium]|nr:nucleoside-binding protein [Bacteroidota bacterium]
MTDLNQMQAYWRVQRATLGLLALFFVAMPARAQLDFQFQYGSLTNPFSGEQRATRILTFQHAGGWLLGDSFFFIDFIDDDKVDGFNDKEFYGEWYPTLSLSKLFGTDLKAGAIRDFSLISGLNFDGDADVLKYLPGLRLSWQVPGFIFLNTDFTAVLDMSNGLAKGGAPTTGDGFMFDVSWLLPFTLGSQSFAFMGHAEYISAVENELAQTVEAWILAQPQLTWDLGKAFGSPNWLHMGVEFQIWRNKLGVEGEGDFVPQFLAIWRL